MFRRLIGLVTLFCAIGGALFLVLQACGESLMFFYTPSSLLKAFPQHDAWIRMGGVVQPSSLRFIKNMWNFILTDAHKQISVQYCGALPGMFAENRQAIIEGYVQLCKIKSCSQVHNTQLPCLYVHAVRVLAKHDERYQVRCNHSLSVNNVKKPYHDLKMAVLK